MAADIKDIGKIGAGGIELNSYYLVSTRYCRVYFLPNKTKSSQYGGLFGTPETNWNIYGFGTPAYNKILKTAAQATKDNGLIMDFAMGPQSGQGVPASSDNRKKSHFTRGFEGAELKLIFSGTGV